MEEREGLLEEYRTLRTEILQNDRVCQGLSVSALALISLSWAAMVWSGEFLLAVLPSAIYLAYLQLLLHKYEGTYRIATYLAAFLEPKIPGLGWETRLRRQREGATAAGFWAGVWSIEALLMILAAAPAFALVLWQFRIATPGMGVPLWWVVVLLAEVGVVWIACQQIAKVRGYISLHGGFWAEWQKVKQGE